MASCYSTSCHDIKRRDSTYSKLFEVATWVGNKVCQERMLRIEVEKKLGPNPINLQVQIFDDNDPFFLYVMKLNGEDFKIMKHQQGLLVDFENFYDHLIRLLDNCLTTDKPKFQVVLVKEDSTLPSSSRNSCLQIIESTNFRNLCYLTLPVSEASDSDIKSHMLHKLMGLQGKIQALESKVASLEKDLDDTTRELKLKDQEYENVLSKRTEEKSVLFMKANRELIEEREKHSKELLECQQNAELEKKCIEDKFQDILKQQEKQISSLKNQLQSSKELQTKLEFSNRELSKQQEVLEKESTSLQKEVSFLKKQNHQLDSDYHEKEREVQSLRTRVAVALQEVSNKNDTLSKLQEATAVLNEEKSKLEDSIVEKEGKLQRLKMSLGTLSEDFFKANQLLSLHQSELVSVKSKLKMSTQVAFEQEKLLEVKSKGIMELREILNQSNKRVEDLEVEAEKLKESLLQAQKTIEEKNKSLHDDKIVIDRLSQRLRELYVQDQNQPLTQWMYKNRAPTKFLIPESSSTPLTAMSNSQPSASQNPTEASVGNQTVQAFLPMKTPVSLQHHSGHPRNLTAIRNGYRSSEATIRNDGINQCEDKKDAAEANEEVTKADSKKRDAKEATVQVPVSGILRGNPPARLSAYFNPVGRK